MIKKFVPLRRYNYSMVLLRMNQGVYSMLGFLFAVNLEKNPSNLNHTQAKDLADRGPYLMLIFVCPLLFSQFKRIVPIHVHVGSNYYFFFC